MRRGAKPALNVQIYGDSIFLGATPSEPRFATPPYKGDFWNFERQEIE